MHVHSAGTPALWVAFAVLVIASLVVDLGIHQKHQHLTTRQAVAWAVVWILLAVGFGAAIYPFVGAASTIDYFTAYILEKSLSVDNLFVFIVVFKFFQIPLDLQRRVLFWGILGAVVMRAVFIFLGVALLSRFEFLFYVFGAFLVYSGLRLLKQREEDVHPDRNWAYRAFRRLFAVSDTIEGGHFFRVENGRRVATRMMVVLVVIEATDLVFAVDSIPAVLAITTDPFVVYTSNIFAILGLRALYFLLAGVMARFRYLNVGLSVVLAFIGAKMILKDVFHIPPMISLAVVGGVLLLSIVASIVADLRERPAA